jgi:tetratricopeptide (TPR) repeat protein
MQDGEAHGYSRFDMGVGMVLRGVLIICTFCLTVGLSACTMSSTQVNDQNTEPFNFDATAQKHKEQAQFFESSGDLHKALVCLTVAADLRPEDKESAKKIAELRERIRNETERHFKMGLDYYQQGSIKAARKELLIVLNYDPNHELALEYLKNRFSPELKGYQVKPGDTLRTIALEQYNDAEMDFLLTDLNALRPDEELSPGTELKIVRVEPPRFKRPEAADPTVADYQNIGSLVGEKRTDQVPQLCNGKRPEECVRLAIDVLMEDPANMEARDLLNSSLYAISEDLITEQRYYNALETLRKIDKSYRDVQNKITTLEKKVRKTSEEHYQNGVKCFMKEDFSGALLEWEKALVLNPGHEKAKRGVKNAARKLGKL